MTSFNHYAFGAIVDWLHRSVAGLGPAAPGYREIVIAPHPIAGLEFARVSHETPYGRAATGWERTGAGALTVTAEIPANTDATVHLPGGSEPFRVGSGLHRWEVELPETDSHPGPLSLTSDLSDIVDDPEALRTLMDVLRGHGETTAREFRAGTAWVRGMPLLDAMRRVPVSVQSDIAAEFDRLNDSRAGRARL
jgi:alpha-L-rhamnosidase